MTWFDKVFTRFECCRYTANRIVAIKKGDHWFRGLRVRTPENVLYVHDMFAPEYSMYVTSFTFSWVDFFDQVKEPPPSSANRKNYSEWFNENLVPTIDDFIKTKDIAFDVDVKNGGLETAARYTLKISDYLDDAGIGHYHMFSGTQGYHTIIENAQKIFEDYGSPLFGFTKKSLSHAAISTAQKMLDDIFDEPFLDRHGNGRSYEDADIDFSPMFPRGLRKAAYSISGSGRIVLPVNDEDIKKIDDVEWFRPANILRRYKIKGRGWNNI